MDDRDREGGVGAAGDRCRPGVSHAGLRPQEGLPSWVGGMATAMPWSPHPRRGPGLPALIQVTL